MKLTIGISPCPNDTFIFDALYAKKITHPDFTFDFILEDVETLNQLAGEGKLDIVKLSYARYFQVMNAYTLLPCGGAMGFGVGPLLVAKQPYHVSEMNDKKIAIPGEHTTAHFLFRNEFPEAEQKHFMLFSEVETALQQNEVDAAVLIHEGRFTYAEKGFHKVIDLGEAWDTRHHLPIPLGGIALKRSLHAQYNAIQECIRKSLRMAWTNYPRLSSWVTSNAQEMSEQVMLQHITLYVNAYTEHIGDDGMKAIQLMKQQIAPENNLPIFLY